MNRTLLVAAALLATAGPAVAATQQVHVFLHNSPLHILPEAISGRVGDVLELTVENPLDPEDPDQGAHDLVFEGYPQRTALLDPGATVPLSVPLETAGNFQYYCSVPGHREAGMFGNLVVQSAGSTGEKASPATALAGAMLALGVVAALRERRT